MLLLLLLMMMMMITSALAAHTHTHSYSSFARLTLVTFSLLGPHSLEVPFFPSSLSCLCPVSENRKEGRERKHCCSALTALTSSTATAKTSVFSLLFAYSPALSPSSSSFKSRERERERYRGKMSVAHARLQDC